MIRVGQNSIYAPYMTVNFVIYLLKIPYTHRIYMVLANPSDDCFARTCTALHVPKICVASTCSALHVLDGYWASQDIESMFANT